MIGIYKITNKKNGMMYIGQSVNIAQRWRGHKKDINRIDSYMYRSMLKHGLDNFRFEVIEECRVDELDEKEIHYIKKYNSLTPNGYNIESGGSNGARGIMLTHEEVYSIKKELKNALSSNDLAEKYNVKPDVITSINQGHSWREDIDYPIRNWREGTLCKDCNITISYDAVRCLECHNKHQRVVERPSAEKLSQMLKETNFTEVGRSFGVSCSTVRKWCKSYNMSVKAEDYKVKEDKRSFMNLDKYFPICLERKNETFNFQNREEWIHYIESNKLSKGSNKAIRSGIGRFLSGSRDSYLGFKMKEQQ